MAININKFTDLSSIIFLLLHCYWFYFVIHSCTSHCECSLIVGDLVCMIGGFHPNSFPLDWPVTRLIAYICYLQYKCRRWKYYFLTKISAYFRSRMKNIFKTSILNSLWKKRGSMVMVIVFRHVILLPLSVSQTLRLPWCSTCLHLQSKLTFLVNCTQNRKTSNFDHYHGDITDDDSMSGHWLN